MPETSGQSLWTLRPQQGSATVSGLNLFLPGGEGLKVILQGQSPA